MGNSNSSLPLVGDLDWWICEPAESARFFAPELESDSDSGSSSSEEGEEECKQKEEEEEESKEPTVAITPEQWDTVIIPKAEDEGSVQLKLEAQRHGEYSKTIELPTPVTLRQFVTAMANFYQHPLSTDEIAEIRDQVPEDVFNYRSGVLQKAAEGKEAHWCDIMGSPPSGRGACQCWGNPAADTVHRFPLFCNGLVRFEGVQRTESGELEVILGS